MSSDVHADTGNVVGNVYDKYGTTNPIARALMRGFLDDVGNLYRQTRARSVLEVGCGEGHLARHLYDLRPPSKRFEVSDVEIESVASDLPSAITVRQASIYDLPYQTSSFDLVVCCEVLEHLEHPAAGVRELARVARHRVLVSTPWEPVWRMLNLARLRYITDWGNTPGHVQHFGRRTLNQLLSPQIRVLTQRTPIPWTILLGEPRR